ncbi:hybrid sensor histidine kinase/response regulator [Cognatilysobacter segetis]|uniref:hybrid sensor histidine kinase/response regulator n=1 Tax=Cognatilysobacter segetis TaxID=2492394 RepID=UPI001EE3AB30|nr:PAS domain-containing protein [Lysobacter segetis]
MAPANLRFMDAPGTVAELMRGHDWRDSPLGPPQQWPQSLRSVVSLLLRSKFPMFVAWGPSLGFLYNDPYAEILGAKHPDALGRPFQQIWSEIWDDIQPLIERALAGEATYVENLPLRMHRRGFDEQTWFTFSYSPVVDEQGDIAGMYCACTETTASVLAERARQAQVQRFASLFEQSPGMVAVTRGRDHVYEIANPAYLDFVGRRGIVGLSVREALPELDQKFIDQLDVAFATGEAYIGRRIAVGLRRGPDDAIENRIVDFVFQPIVGEDGRVDGIFVQGSDITEQAIAEREAQTERRRLDAVIDSLPSGVALADPSGTITRVNAANHAIWGTHPMSATIDGYGEWQGWWADDSPRRGQRLRGEDWALARALRGETVRDDVVEIQPFDGQPRRTLLLQATPVRLDDGTVAGAVVAQTDISDRMRAQAELRASESRFRTIADAMPQIVWSARTDGYYDYFNRQWYAYTGVPEGETFDGRWGGVVHPDDQSEAWVRWQHSLDTGEPYEMQYRLLHRSGEYRWLLERAVPVRDDRGEVVRWLGTCTDVHEQRLQQQALERSERALRETDRRKDEFLAMLAHELRNPLAPISTASQLLLLSDDPARVRAAGEVIGRQVRHMTELVDDLLDVSRVTRGLVQLDMETVDLRSVVSSAIEQVRPLIDARRHALQTQLPAEPLWVHGDRTRLTQIVSNLLNNAAKYTPESGRLVVDARASEGRIVVHVRDNGQGIEPALLPQIFDLFTQAERSPDRAQGGLGIGLALVRSLVTLHGGTVTAASDGRGRGATFTVALPSATAPPTRVRTPTGVDAERADGPLDVVVVDDNVDAARTLQVLLETLGHRVRVFHRADDALAGLVSVPADLAFLDIGLPDMTGDALARRVRERLGPRTGMLVALSGYGQPQDLAASKAAGLEAHLVKPIDRATLSAVLQRAQAAQRAG